MVFVLDKRKRPLMPCTEKRARLLLARGRAAVCRLRPFTIRLTDRRREEAAFAPVALKLDPGARTTGVALIREELAGGATIHHALHLANLQHRIEGVSHRMRLRAGFRRRRRVARLRYRPRRYYNRRRRAGELTPSMRSHTGNLLTWTQRYGGLAPVMRIEIEAVRFDTQRLQNPEISGVEYQRGDLFGFEVWEYLLEKWGRKCAYCGASDVPLEKEHIVPRSRGGTDRVSNLTVACHPCNQVKGARTAAEFGHPEVQAGAKAPLRAAAAVTTTRRAAVEGLRGQGFPVGCWSGGRTKWNRVRFGLSKTHALDALCVGQLDGISGERQPILNIQATGRGQHCRTRTDSFGFPRGYCLRRKQVHGFQTGDLVRAIIPRGRRAGTHVGRAAVRASGYFRVGGVDGVNWRHCQLLQRADGYQYQLGKEITAPVPGSSVGAGKAVGL